MAHKHSWGRWVTAKLRSPDPGRKVKERFAVRPCAGCSTYQYWLPTLKTTARQMRRLARSS